MLQRWGGTGKSKNTGDSIKTLSKTTKKKKRGGREERKEGRRERKKEEGRKERKKGGRKEAQ